MVHLTDDDALGANAVDLVTSAASEKNSTATTLSGLLRLVVEEPAKLQKLFGAKDARFVIGCRRPRAVQALVELAGVKIPAEAVTWVTLAAGTPEPAGGPKRGPWYPVIDYARCKQCGQCFSYCLFGVYTTDAKNHVTVRNPLNCKNGCPACARICPAVAIIFPLYAEGPINGDPVTADAKRVAVDLESVLGADPMKTLAERRKRVLDARKVEQALAEREAALAEAKKGAKAQS